MDIENYFESEDFFNSLRPIAEKVENNYFEGFSLIEYFIDLAIKYYLLFRNFEKVSTKEISDFIEKVAYKVASMDIKNMIKLSKEFELSSYVTKLYIDELLSKLNLKRENLNDDNCKKSLCAYIVRNLHENDYKYHAFNSACLDSILAYGINPNVNLTPQREFDIINDIFEKKGIKMIFGWHKLNCEGKVSYSKTSSVSYYYGINSPEWFAQFTGKGSPFYPPEKYEKNAYVFGNHDSAKNNLITLMQEHNFSNLEQEIVIDFFEKNWKIYANKAPMLAAVPNVQKEYAKYLIDMLLSEPYYKNNMEKIMDFCLNLDIVDCQTTEKIDVSNAMFIKMPRYDELIRKLSYKKNEAAQTNGIKNYEELLYKKLINLDNAKIKLEIDNDGQYILVNDNEKQELLIVQDILKDNDAFQAIVTNKYGEQLQLDSWISYFDKNIINNPENIKLLAVNKPFYFNCVSEENRNNIELMREVASQRGIHPILTCYVGKNVQNDFEFISNLIINSDEKTFDFYDYFAGEFNKSNMRYRESIGLDVQCNPFFWQLLNSKITSINENTTKKMLFFSIEKELNLARENRNILVRDISEDSYKVTNIKH